MSLEALLVHTVTIQRAGTTTDTYGDELPDWSSPTETSSAGRMVQQSRDEVLGNRDANVTEWHLYLPADTDVTSADRIAWNGGTYEIVGEPAAPVRRSSAVHHLELTLRKVDG